MASPISYDIGNTHPKFPVLIAHNRIISCAVLFFPPCFAVVLSRSYRRLFENPANAVSFLILSNPRNRFRNGGYEKFFFPRERWRCLRMCNTRIEIITINDVNQDLKFTCRTFKLRRIFDITRDHLPVIEKKLGNICNCVNKNLFTIDSEGRIRYDPWHCMITQS